MATALIESHFLPCLEYCCALESFENIILEHDEYYVKQSYRNRCYINTANGVEMMVVPVTGKSGKIPFRDVRLASGQRWRNNLWRTIQSAYGNAPFFEHYSDDLNRMFSADFRFLHELNHDLLSFCLKAAGNNVKLSATVSYEKERHDVSDLRWQINPKENWSSRAYFSPHVYTQVFGSSFAENLSVIDLLFCAGPQTAATLKASRKKI